MNDQKIQITDTVYTVSELTTEIKSIIENRYPFIWIKGEISNLARPSSGHLYFTLKDKAAQIAAVMFRAQTRALKFNLENGLEISGFGRISLYEPRGFYQFIFEFVQPKGAGALQLAFEQLKEKLFNEGLFESVHKKELPYLPRRISVVTSLSGAVIHDIQNILSRRFSNTIIEIAPVSVQGTGAESEISSALSMLNQRKKSDLIIIARGGGSLEDLAPFNSETVARAVFNSTIPVVSAVGHETDYTICDFVSDLRAPTPSAAAELVMPDKRELVQKLASIKSILSNGIIKKLTQSRQKLDSFSSRITDPKRRIHDLQFLIEDLRERSLRAFRIKTGNSKERLKWQTEKLIICSPLQKTRLVKNNLEHKKDTMKSLIFRNLQEKQLKVKSLTERLTSLNPSAVIERGYSITRTIPEGRIVTDSDTVDLGQDLEVILSKGSIRCSVKGVN